MPKVICECQYVNMDGERGMSLCAQYEDPSVSRIQEPGEGRAWIGFSLSFCVKDILEGLIRLEDVIAIIAATKMDGGEEAFIQRALDAYSPVYWRAYSVDEARRVLQELYPRVVQPRLTTDMSPHTGAMMKAVKRHWKTIPVLRGYRS